MARYLWAELTARSDEVFALPCSMCEEAMQVRGLISDGAQISPM